MICYSNKDSGADKDFSFTVTTPDELSALVAPKDYTGTTSSCGAKLML